MRPLLPLLLLASLGTPAAKAEVEMPYLSVGGLVAFRGGSQVSSFVGAWTPFVSLGGGYAVRADLGASLLKDSLGDLFVGVHGELLSVIPIVEDVAAWEIGGGGVYWSGTSGGFNPILSTGVAVALGGTIFDRVTTTYSFHFIGSGVHWIRLTLGLHWTLLD